jgi:hypothetical protein
VGDAFTGFIFGSASWSWPAARAFSGAAGGGIKTRERPGVGNARSKFFCPAAKLRAKSDFPFSWKIAISNQPHFEIRNFINGR